MKKEIFIGLLILAPFLVGSYSNMQSEQKLVSPVVVEAQEQVVPTPTPTSAPVVKVPKDITRASYYCEGFEGNKTANGEIYSCEAMTCAHKTLPFGTKVKLMEINSGMTAECVVNDRGPFVEGRGFDLSKAVFEKLAPVSRGVITVKWSVIE